MNPDSTLTQADLESLRLAKDILEHPGLTAQITHVIGTPIEAGLKRLPQKFHQKLGAALEGVLLKIANTAAYTMKDGSEAAPYKKLHMLGAAVSGGVAGFFGPWAMLAEVPVTTGIIFRSIAEIARSEGESIKDVGTRMACVEVFALGGKSATDDATESGYYAVRATLAQQVRAATEFLVKGAPDKTAPLLLSLVKKVVERLGVQYTEKLGAQLIPVIGSVGGAAINTIFIHHFQNMAKGHFVVRRLERRYGREAVQAAYEQLSGRSGPGLP